MSDTQKFHDQDFQQWSEGLSEDAQQLQFNLSCLVDGELDEAAAARVMVQMEESPECRAFFDDARLYVRLHKDMADPERLEARIAMLAGVVPGSSDAVSEAEQVDLIHRLATIFYQLGKAYVLAAIKPETFSEPIFETPVPVEDAQAKGRGFVDGVLLTGKAGRTGLDWRQARHMLNGRLERIAEPLEKGRRLLLQALETEPDHEEAKIYMAFLHSHEGKTLKAADLYREVFDTAMSEGNRGFAANQLGRLYHLEEDSRKALICWRWLAMTGLADRDDRFWMTRYNIGVAYAYLGDQTRTLDYWRRLLDAHPDHVADVAEMLAATPKLRSAIESQAGFSEALLARCPELFDCATQEAKAPGGE